MIHVSDSTKSEKSPKRCLTCKTIIPRQLERCAFCSSGQGVSIARDSRARRGAQSRTATVDGPARAAPAGPIRSFRSPSGELVELPLSDPFVHGTYTYEIGFSPSDRLKPNQACGLFLDQLLGVIFARPKYLRAADVHRYASLIHRFGQFNVKMGWGQDKSETPVRGLPLERIGFALRQWIEDECANATMPLMATYVLDASRFIEAHALGRSFWDEKNGTWRITPMTDGLLESGFDRIADPRLKRDITSSFAGLLVRLELPAGCRITSERTKAVVSAGTAYFGIERCHLSTGVYDYTDAQVEEVDAPLHDVAQEFELRGKLWPSEAVSAIVTRDYSLEFREERFLRLEVPGRWITAYLDDELKWVAVPRWEP